MSTIAKAGGNPVKWYTKWWGIVIQAESASDRELLEKLKSVVGESAFEAYEEGKLHEETQDGKCFKLVFQR